MGIISNPSQFLTNEGKRYADLLRTDGDYDMVLMLVYEDNHFMLLHFNLHSRQAICFDPMRLPMHKEVAQINGVVLVRFKDRKDAQKCIELMNGRWFGGRQIHASEDDGSVNHALIRDLDHGAERLEQFGAELEAE